MINLPGVFFAPWRGDRFGESRWGRLLILGESHYEGDVPPTSAWTIEEVTAYLDGIRVKSFWTKIGQVVTGDEAWQYDRRVFWNSVAFYNYVQEAVTGSDVK